MASSARGAGQERVAELEAGLISERTKAALAAARARGVKLGNPNGARALRGKQAGNAEAVASTRRIAQALNARGILTPRGGQWHATSAARVLERLQVGTLR